METDIVVKEQSAPVPLGAVQTMMQTREMSEIQAMVISAKKFPRELGQVRADILASCDSPALAEYSQYAYSKGGTEITGASIRLAEELAGAFQNVDKGWIELERKSSVGNVPGESLIQCFAWDMQRNVKAKRTFTVRHWRDTKKGGYALKDEREIYELCANQAARRLRACILEIIPKFIVDEAIDRCDATMKKATGPMNTEIPKMLTAFEKIGVSKEMIEKRCQRKAEAIDSTQFGSLRKIYQSLVDGMSKLDQWFEVGASGGETAPAADPQNEPPPATQSIGKKTATKEQEKVNKPATNSQVSAPQNLTKPSTVAPNIKNSAPTKEEIDAKKHAAANPPPADPAPIESSPEEFALPTEELPTFKEVWQDCGAVALALWGPSKARAEGEMAKYCREKTGKGGMELFKTNDVATLIKIYEMLLKEEKPA